MLSDKEEEAFLNGGRSDFEDSLKQEGGRWKRPRATVRGCCEAAMRTEGDRRTRPRSRKTTKRRR